MRYFYPAILAGLLAGCGKPTPVTVDPVLAPYFASFTQNTGADTNGISAKFADTSTTTNPLGETVGECQLYSDGTRVIQIDSNYWASITSDQKEQLVFHELGHCSLYLGHTPGDMSGGSMNGCPISIMDPYSFGQLINCYTGNKSYYYQELKQIANL